MLDRVWFAALSRLVKSWSGEDGVTTIPTLNATVSVGR